MDRTIDYDYKLPPDRIAQQPRKQRDHSRLLALNRLTGQLQQDHFFNLPNYLQRGDVLVINDSRVIPARLYGRKEPSGGRVEILLLEQLSGLTWTAMVGGKKLDPGVKIRLLSKQNELTDVLGVIEATLDGSLRKITFNRDLGPVLDQIGHVPLPPYIKEEIDDPERYQTVYAANEGSAAAPTAGLHLTPELLISLRKQGVLIERVTLHIGLDTFKPVTSERVADHKLHSEWARLAPESARRINEAKLAGGRIVAVGTTAVRVLETAALRSAGISGSLIDISARDKAGETFNICPWKPVVAHEGSSDLFIYPGYRFRAVDVLITNFHLPKSTLLMLVSAFAGRENILEAYETAMEAGFNFFSFGDAMIIY